MVAKATSLRKDTEQKARHSSESSPGLPAYFLSVKIKNYRCFGPEQILDLSHGNRVPAQWTIILGDNGIGKTTLLQCLSYAEPETDVEENGETSYHPALKVGNSMELIKHNNRSQSPDFSFSYNISLGEYLVPKTNHREECLISISTAMKGMITSTVGTTDNLSNLLLYGYGASRRIGASTLSSSQTNDTTASLFSDNANLLNAEEWLLQTDYAANRPTKISMRAAKYRDQVIETLISLLPEVDKIRFVDPEAISAPTVEFNTPYGWVPLKGLSLGYRTLITWMVDLASRMFERYPNSPNPLAEPAIVLVDEIDLHLHPKWQRTLMQFLTEKFPNTQFIATAHSPLVVQSAVGANIVLLRREGDHVVIDNDFETIKNWRVDQILTSELFGLESARPAQTDAAMAERNKILSKSRLTKADEKRLEELRRQIGNLPTGETPEDLNAMDIIRRAAQLLKTE